jgi:hypothetical protein
MAKSLKEVMSGKSEEGLMDYLNNFQKYTPEAIMSASDELKRRGRTFSDEELKEIDLKIENRKKSEEDEDTLFGSDSWRKRVVKDPNAPLLYSKGAIRAFSLVFSTMFGAVLLSTNIKDNKGKWNVIGFGLIYTAVTIIIMNLAPLNTYYVFMLNTVGGLGLVSTFWNKYVGQETVYRAKPIWKALIISIIITIPFLLAIIYG